MTTAQEGIEREAEEQEGFLIPGSERRNGDEPPPIAFERDVESGGHEHEFRVVEEISAFDPEQRKEKDEDDRGEDCHGGR
jgi:hypothetical protein